MQNYRITVSYDGTRYLGWQKQGKLGDKDFDSTIQGKLERILFKKTGKEIAVNGSGRTDAGVHAIAQVANFILPKAEPEEELKAYFNEYLPEDIAVTEVKKAEERFHARLSAKAKRYLYRIQNSAQSNVFERKYMYQIPEHLDVEAMEEAAGYLMGEHDFKSFCANKRMKKSTVRTIYDIEIEREGDEVSLLFYGNGFLYNMVRILTGTLIEVGLHERRPEEMPLILEACDRASAGVTAPARGLTLVEVEY